MQPLKLTVPIIAAALLASGASAHLPELYGREYLRVDPARFSPPENPSVKRPRTPPGEEEAAYENQIRDRELAAGPYSPGLADPLANLSRYHLERGEVEAAMAALRRAIQLVRINDGLYSRAQLPLLRQLMDIQRGQGDHAGLGDSYGYYYRVALPDQGPPGEEELAVALEYLAWERELFASRSDGEQRSHLLRAYQANDRLLRAAQSGDPQIYLALAMSQMHNLYLVLGDQPLALALGMGDPTQEERALSALQKVALAEGIDLLEDSLELAQALPPRQQAELHLELGDWLHWNGKLFRAREQYGEVIALMRAAGEQQQLASWFDEPVELPDQPGLWSRLQEDNGEPPIVVQASYEVTSRGESRRIEVSVEDTEARWQASKIRGMLRDTHFRPRIGPDGPEPGPRVTRHYRLVRTR